MSAPTLPTPVDVRWRLPLSRDSMGTYFFDADRQMIAQIRGWGHLTGSGGLQLTEAEAVAVQNARMDHIVECVNRHAALVTALTNLAHEATGFVAHADQPTHGWTNIRVLQQRIDEAWAALQVENAR